MLMKSAPKMVLLFVSSVKSPQKNVGGGGQQSRGFNFLGLFFNHNLIKYNTTVVITLLLWCWAVYLVQRINYFTAAFRFKWLHSTSKRFCLDIKPQPVVAEQLNAKPHTSRKFWGFIRRGTKPGRNYIISKGLFHTHTAECVCVGGGSSKYKVI